MDLPINQALNPSFGRVFINSGVKRNMISWRFQAGQSLQIQEAAAQSTMSTPTTKDENCCLDPQSTEMSTLSTSVNTSPSTLANPGDDVNQLTNQLASISTTDSIVSPSLQQVKIIPWYWLEGRTKSQSDSITKFRKSKDGFLETKPFATNSESLTQLRQENLQR